MNYLLNFYIPFKVIGLRLETQVNYDKVYL